MHDKSRHSVRHNRPAALSALGGSSRYEAHAGLLFHSASLRTAFTLAEMVVSVGVLVLVLLTAGRVFTITLSSTGKARGLTEANQNLRALEDRLRSELAGVSRTRSIMVMQANAINAHWTAQMKETDLNPASAADGGYNYPADPEREDLAAPGQLQLPRADMLAFVTYSPEQSFADSSGGQSSNTQWIVYGHAEIGDLDPTAPPGSPAWRLAPESLPPPFDSATYFPRTADTWHLARRSVLIVPTPDPGLPGTQSYASDLTDVNDAGKGPGGSGPLRSGVFDTVSTSVAGLNPPVAPATGILYSENFDCYAGLGTCINQNLDWMLRPIWLIRSHLDPDPPPAFAAMLGHYLLPNCCSFKVEWTFDLRGLDPALANEPEIYWFDPAQPDPLIRLSTVAAAVGVTQPNRGNALQAIYDDSVGNPQFPNYLSQRFGTAAYISGAIDSSGNAMSPFPIAGQPTWYDRDPYNPTSGDPDPYFPTALRITVDVMDAQGRFDRPLRHVMILPVGAE